MNFVISRKPCFDVVMQTMDQMRPLILFSKNNIPQDYQVKEIR
jgi:hypothetical protein